MHAGGRTEGLKAELSVRWCPNGGLFFWAAGLTAVVDIGLDWI